MKIKKQAHSFIFLSIVAAAILLGCDSGGDLAGGGQSGTGVTGVSSGEISDFGSIYVNGVRFDTSEAQIFVEGYEVGQGDTAVLDNLDRGQVVKVQGTIIDDSNGEADQVFYEKSLMGPVGSVMNLDPYTLRITILGQQVIADNNTRWYGVDAATVAPDDILEVSGYLDEDGVLMATFMAERLGAAPYIVKGAVAALNPAESTFAINGVVVDFSAIAGSTPPLGEGDLVRVEGVLVAVDTLEASEVILWYPVDPPDDIARPAVIAGFVNQFVSAQDFYVDHYPVTTDAETLFVGIAADDIADGMGLVIFGTLQDGVVQAETVRLNDFFAFLFGTVETINLADGTFTLAEDPTALIRTSTATEISGRVSTFDGLVPDDMVMVRGWHRPDDSISALELYVFP